ncbi:MULTISPECIES: helix-turn-helix domain-containing protein [unclassified Fusibacter]|uniref:helix-turn-helix domain-containing protein n=1 Tax=unclassified Fusibacter TaxID=2624464 RepID=UPI001012EC45|nr:MULTISPECIES: XRE family transcriptional regulator [unclassified Fusibacter]MCK8059394.1 XRE family transcriptional regulator [Fusibacter sp. A2]NPE21142.1 helix-turn-helix transcriptional regulator [Fusibacter sp. A1]RXV62411.1 XRE family transcriptional regulator [Fusibacter sp. A1]
MLNQLGKRIKEMRVKKEMTLKNLSDATGLSTGFISQLERGLTTISVDSLQKLSDALEVNLNYFFKTAVKREDVVLKRHQRSILSVENQFIYYQMSSDYTDKLLFPRMIELLPQKELEKIDTFSHEGEEFIYVVEGILTLVVDDELYELYPGETAHFNSARSHNWYNATNQLVKILAVSHPNRLAEQE